MPSARLALIAALCAGVLGGGSPAVAQPVVDYVGTYVWTMSDADFGGFSGLEIADDGSTYTALSDRATVRWGSIQRDQQGRIRGLTVAGRARLRDSTGKPLKPGFLGDSEGLAVDSDGRLCVSFEGLVRIACYDTPDAPATLVPKLRAFKTLAQNTALEALAVTPNGDLLTIPEAWAADQPYPVWRLRDGAWSAPFTIPRDGPWAPVGADVGPDGRLYLLERDFKGLFGFATRVRRFDMADDTLSAGEVLLETRLGQYDNLEGMAVWNDGQGIRLTMISDDNFLFVQRTELVEYRVRDTPLQSTAALTSATSKP